MASYIKTTVPYWHEKVGKEMFDRFTDLLKETSPLSEKEWEKPNIAKAIQKYGQFLHLETDITDSSEGIKPRQVRALNRFKDDEIIHLFTVLNSYVGERPLSNYVDTDGFLSWKLFFHNIFENEVLRDKKTFSFNKLMKIIYINLETRLNNYVYADDFEFSQENIEALKLLENEGLINDKFKNGEPISEKDLSIDEILNERKALWKRIQSISPQSKWILLANPNNFSKLFIQKIQEVFKERQLTKLEDKTQKYIGSLLNTLGENIVLLSAEEILRGESLPFNSTAERNIDSNITILKKINQVQKLNINTLIHYSKFLTDNKDLKSELFKKNHFTENDLSVLSYIGEKLNQLPQARRNRLLKIPFQYWAIFYRYRVPVVTDIEALNNLYEENKDNKLNIPIVKGKIGAYTYEILEKSNPMGLILGYATNCCQVMTDGNAGTQCLVEGYRNPNSTFFVVRKGKKIYAQSWIWQNKDVLCFDSIEVLGKDLNKNKDVLKAYLETSEKLIDEHGYKTIFTGADGNIIPEGLRDVGEYYSPCPQELRIPFNCYSDAQSEIVILSGKDNFKDNHHKQKSNLDEDEILFD